MKKIIVIASILGVLVSVDAFAQPGNPSTPAPLDGGLLILGAAGVALGAKKAYQRFKGD